MKHPKLKICGITQIEQGVAIAEMGVDALGFVLYPKSPRYIEPLKIRHIIRQLPPFTKTVGVFVNEPVDVIESVIKTTGLDLVQLSGDETPAYCASLSQKNINWIKALRVKSSFTPDQVFQFKQHYMIVDTWSAGEFGGTGQEFNWDLLNGLKGINIILAGGITIENVSKAIRQVAPYAIDISSGVEISPGVKSLNKTKMLLELVKNC